MNLVAKEQRNRIHPHKFTLWVGIVAPDDLQAILPQTAAHRLVPVHSAGRGRVEQVRAMVEAVGLP